MGLSKRQNEGVKRLKRSAEHATAEFALLHERDDNVSFVDRECVAGQAQASERGYAPSWVNAMGMERWDISGANSLHPLPRTHPFILVVSPPEFDHQNITAQQNH